MLQLEILQEFPVSETGSEQCWKRHRQTCLTQSCCKPVCKNEISVKSNKEKYNKTRFTCAQLNKHLGTEMEEVDNMEVSRRKS